MLIYVVTLIFLTALQIGSSSPQSEKGVAGPQSVRIKKNEVSANGVESHSEILRNFRNPVLEYLLSRNKDESTIGPKKGMVREIRHSQTLVLPNFWKEFWPSTGTFLPRSDSLNTVPKTSRGNLIHNSNHSPLLDYLVRLTNETSENVEKSRGHTIKSQLLRVNEGDDNNDLTKIQVYPAVGISLNTFGKNGDLKSSLVHFQPDFNVENIAHSQKEAFFLGSPSNAAKNFKSDQNNQFNYLFGDNPITPQRLTQKHNHLAEKLLLKPDSFTDLNNPLMNLQNLGWTSVYNAVSSIVEYEPNDVEGEKDAFSGNEITGKVSDDTLEQFVSEPSSRPTIVAEPLILDRGEFLTGGGSVSTERLEIQKLRSEEPNFFDEVTMKSDVFSRIKKRPINNIERIKTSDKEEPGMRRLRSKRDTTSVFLSTKHGDQIGLALEEPVQIEQNQRKPAGGDLIIRKGGIAIAGPGGAATAYTGGTAIVGPYGTVYKSPEGVAIVGPYSKIINITDDTSFEDILQMHKEAKGQRQNENHNLSQNDNSRFKNFRNFFSYITDLPIQIDMRAQRKQTHNRSYPKIARLKESDVTKVIEKMRTEGLKKIMQETRFEEKMAKENETTLIFRPRSKAEAGKNGVAVSTPISHAIVLPGQKPKIYFEPESVASAGPLGLAHAHSDLFVSYFPNNTAIKSYSPDRDLKEILQRRINQSGITNAHDEKARSFSPLLVKTPALSSILKPPAQEARQLLGYANDKRRKAKPPKPIKEEGTSEEVGEEHEEENGNQQEQGNEGVAVSPPPEGASVAEAKPIGLAIAGPGGVAASKPQGTAVAGPGGLAIARPVGTAIAGVEVEGSVPIGGHNKNKKKPKQEKEQEKEQTEGELHYVGGLTGPIGNPQPKEFADLLNYKSVRNTDSNNFGDNTVLRGRQNSYGFQLKLGEQNGKFGFVPFFSYAIPESEGAQKKVDNPTFFHGLLGGGNSGQDFDQFQNYRIRY